MTRLAAKLFIFLLTTVGCFAQSAPVSLQMQAPAPPQVTGLSASVTGNAGIQTYFYSVIARYPSGTVISAPVRVTSAPASPTASNGVQVSWSPAVGATGYDVVRQLNANFAGSCTGCLLVSNTSLTAVLDQGQSLTSYTAGASAAGGNATLYLNTRDYPGASLRAVVNGADAGQLGTGTTWYVVTFAANPTFNLAFGDPTITLTSNITGFTITGLSPNKKFAIRFCQDSAGNRTVTGAPSNVHGFFTVGSAASLCSVQPYESFDGSDVFATSAGVINQ